MNEERHTEYINAYNEQIKRKLYKAMEYHGFEREQIAPLTKDGVKKCLGVWDFDGSYSRFKTLGAKRYLVQYSKDNRNKKKDFDKIQLTVSGLNKQKCVPWMIEKWGKDGVFEAFNNVLYVPPEHTGKMTHTYIDEEKNGVVIDYLGLPGKYQELSSIHLENSDYSLSISSEYAEFIANIQSDDW